MVDTIFGKLNITINRKPAEATLVKLPNKYRHFKAVGRYKLSVDIENPTISKMEIKLEIVAHSLQGFYSSGEDLAQATFVKGTKKMCIGTKGDILGVEYSCTNNSLILMVSPQIRSATFLFLIAWCDSDNYNTDNIEFLADPTWCGDY